MMAGQSDDQAVADRRPLASRSTGWAQGLAKLLLRTNMTPNAVSAIGIIFSALGGLAFAYAPDQAWLYLVGAVFVQLRLLCNLLDGMVAVEGGRGSPTGTLFNEIPDRFEDSFLIIGFSYGAGIPELGYVAAILAVLTAYLRAFGASLGFGQDFRGPMAKPQRMAALTVGGGVAFLEALLLQSLYSPIIILAIMIAGTLWTCARRIGAMSKRLRKAA